MFPIIARENPYCNIAFLLLCCQKQILFLNQRQFFLWKKPLVTVKKTFSTENEGHALKNSEQRFAPPDISPALRAFCSEHPKAFCFSMPQNLLSVLKNSHRTSLSRLIGKVWFFLPDERGRALSESGRFTSKKKTKLAVASPPFTENRNFGRAESKNRVRSYRPPFLFSKTYSNRSRFLSNRPKKRAVGLWKQKRGSGSFLFFACDFALFFHY